MRNKKITPALRQYLSLKEKFRDAILMFRMGDFYEMFFDDAEIASRELEITLTSRAFGKSNEKVPMCGVPYHSVETYIARLVRKGYRVAICEQLEEPKPGKKVVERDVVRVITPGTYFEDETEDRFLMAVFPCEDSYGVAWTGLSTGNFFFTAVDRDGLLSLVSKFLPKEIVVPEGFSDYQLFKEVVPEVVVQERSISSRKGCEEAAVVLLREFIFETQRSFAPKLKEPKRYTGEQYLQIDPQTQRNLELIQPVDRKSGATLFKVLDRTKTGMGRRLLKFWILHPLKDKAEIEKRLDAVEELKDSFLIADELRECLSKVYDIERLMAKITSGIATPRDVVSLKLSFSVLPDIKKLLENFGSPLLREICEDFDTLYDIYCEIDRILVDAPPISSREGGLIRDGVSRELDELRRVREEAESIIKSIETRERQRTGIASLKVGFNNVFGYYIEVSKPNLHLVPDDYIRKQTLVNAERFVTPELKEFEEKVLSAQERIEKIEYEIFTELRGFISENSQRISSTAEKLALVDVLLSLSKVANERDYVRPKISSGFNIEIKGGRHPVLERFLEEDFVPNDTRLNGKEFILIVTGPNMGGKSVFLRQTALLVLMAQMGSFVPAEEAVIGLVDRIFSRVGAADNLSRGLSTFMMEMVETANILKNATSDSLIILDEIGRGTSTYDGMSIARAVVEYISSKLEAKTLFATHYHELTELEGKVRGVKNYRVTVEEMDGEIVFTHKVLPGALEKSYGVHVAKLAGLPEEVIRRAKEILSELEIGKQELPLFRVAETKVVTYEPGSNQEVERLIEFIDSIEISNTTPLEALMLLSKLKEMLKKVKD